MVVNTIFWRVTPNRSKGTLGARWSWEKNSLLNTEPDKVKENEHDELLAN
jgi:hypothetical protein